MQKILFIKYFIWFSLYASNVLCNTYDPYARYQHLIGKQ
jgi:hypothetical protein